MKSRSLLFPLALALLVLAACGDSPTGAGAAEAVRIRFGVMDTGASPARLAAPGAPLSQAAGDALVISGDNGVLTITDLRVIVEEFELKQDDDLLACDDDGGGNSGPGGGDDDDGSGECGEFETGPFFVDVPLAGGQVTVATGEVPAGTYDEAEFEVEDLDDDEENPAVAQRIQALLQQIRQEFPAWPRDASMLVVGTFTPRVNGAPGTPRPFQVFVEAEIEVEVALSPPLVVAEGSGPRDLAILLDPAAVFRQGANVIDLSNFAGRELEFESRVGHGFRGRGGSDD